MAADLQLMTVVRRLSLYLREHPQACDTSDGIGLWWFGPDIMCDSIILDEALDWLQAQGLIVPVPAFDGRVRYRRADVGREGDARLDAVLAGITANVRPMH